MYREKLNSVKALQTSPASRLLAYWIMGIMAVSFLVLFLPWQQNIQGSGLVTAFTPADRPQTVETAIAGRIKEWRVREGVYVAKGDTLVVLTEVKDKFFDPEMLTRIEEQLTAKVGGMEAKEAKMAALDNQIEALKAGLALKLEQTDNKVVQKRLKVQSDSMALEAAKVDAKIYQRQFEAAQNMFNSGLIALVKLEESRSKQQKAQSTLIEYQNKLDAAKNDLEITILDLRTLRAEASEKIAKAYSDRNATLSDLQDSRSDYSKGRNDYANMQIRSQQYFVLAPQDGYVVKALQSGIGETVKEGEALLTIMPYDPEKAIEIYVKAMDVPLLDTGRHVRLQFDGWPALQISGLSELVAVGTFGGKVRVIDYVSSKPGKYRVLVTPDKREGDKDWPSSLRLGSAAYGWVMLEKVPIWYEIWRQLNGFPPQFYEEQPYEKDGGDKDKKGKEEPKKEEEEKDPKKKPKPKA